MNCKRCGDHIEDWEAEECEGHCEICYYEHVVTPVCMMEYDDNDVGHLVYCNCGRTPCILVKDEQDEKEERKKREVN